MPIKLSILICTINGREDSFNELLLSLRRQHMNNCYEKTGFYPHYKKITLTDGGATIVKLIYDNLEIIYCKDNKEMLVGEKRNKLVESANGVYVVEADDDDRLEGDYIKELLEGIESGADVITFQVSVSLNGAEPKICYYSKNFDADYNEPNAYFRLPNHLMCVKRELALQVKFPLINFGEDAEYAKRLKPLLKTEYSIDKVLYHYDFNSKTTETQR